MDEIAAVKNHRGRNGGKNGRPPDGVTAQTVGEQEQQKNQRRAERDRREPQRGFVELIRIVQATQPEKRQRGVMKYRTVVFVRVVAVAALLPEFADLDGVDGLVVVERAGV